MKLFKAFGTQVVLDQSWFIFIGILFVMSYISSGIAAAIGQLIIMFVLFASVTAHEFAHIAAGRVVGIHVPKVVLHMFGGAALFPVIPFGWTELWIAVVGPVFSLIAGAICGYILVPITAGMVVCDLFKVFAWVNVMLGLFNLLPIFPMDGGRMARGLLFVFSKKPVWSTKIVVYGSWALVPVVVYYINGGLWTIVIFGLIMFMGFGELQSVQKRYDN